ncbi:unnamed protein product [Adineta steineri]|uniref:U-box domain-containing protein n=1 Tax=Adineta steineri TaxID=433720 RepID=A0A818QJJ9_9BILA|nr:unnamed protein product [Adineta steineri]CAF3637480.1 unnamed protein product [Adineta steineri]
MTNDSDATPLLSIQLAHTLRGHTSDVNSVIFSPTHAEKPLLASCSSDKTIRLWNLTSLTSKALTRHTYQVHCLAFSPILDDDNDSTTKYMASVSTDGTCLLWDLTNHSVLKEYKHDSDSPIRVCQFSSDGVLLATAGDDELINIWDITASSSRPLKTLAGHSGSIVALRFFSNLLISGSFSGDLKIWVINSSFTGPVHFEREAHDLGVTCIDIHVPFSTENHGHHHSLHVIASGGNDNNVKIWHCSSAKQNLTNIRTLKKHTCAVMCVSFGIKDYLASGSGDKTIIIWNYNTGHCIHQFEAHTRYVTCCSFSFDGQYLASGSNDRMVNIWKIDYNENENDNNEEKHKKSKNRELKLNPIDQWTIEMVQQWLEQFNIKTDLNLTGNDLLLKSDNEILALFNNNVQLLNELSALRHTHFVKKTSTKKTNQNIKSDENNESAIPNEFLCPITHELMVDPVCISDGYTYERKAIEEWLANKQTSPMMNVSIKKTQLYSNKVLKMLIDKYMQQH